MLPRLRPLRRFATGFAANAFTGTGIFRRRVPNHQVTLRRRHDVSGGGRAMGWREAGRERDTLNIVISTFLPSLSLSLSQSQIVLEYFGYTLY